MRYIIVLTIILLLIINRPIKFNDLEKLKDQNIQVEVKGHLNNPGIFELEHRTQLSSLLDQLDLKTDSDYSHLNLNRHLLHKDVIVINQVSAQKLVSINGASLDELMTLKGIGKVMAERIIDYRKNIGPFKALEEIKNVKGVGDKVFENIKDYISL